MTTARYDIDALKNRSVLSPFFDVYSQEEEFKIPENTVDALLQNETELANLWLCLVQCGSQKTLNKYSNRGSKPERIAYFKSLFSAELLSWVLAHTNRYISSQIREIIEVTYPELSLMEAILTASWQAYVETQTPQQYLQLLNNLNNLPPPFEDNRFSAGAIHTNCYKKGLAHSPWLLNIPGPLVKLWDEERQCRIFEKLDRAHRGIYMDAKLGVLFLFEGKPSMTVTFNIDRNGDIFVHQIQAFIKDRGHYKLGAEWRQVLIRYLKSVFPANRVYLINGVSAANDVYRSYNAKSADGFKPSRLELEQIKQVYDSHPAINTEVKIKSDIEFKQVA